MVNKSDVVAIKFHFNKSILKSNAWSPVPSSIAGERNYINIWGCFWLNSITWSTDIQPAVWVEPHTRYTVQDFSCLFSGCQTSLSLSIAKKGSVPSVNGFSSAGVIQCPKARQSHSNSWLQDSAAFICLHRQKQTHCTFSTKPASVGPFIIISTSVHEVEQWLQQDNVWSARWMMTNRALNHQPREHREHRTWCSLTKKSLFQQHCWFLLYYYHKNKSPELKLWRMWCNVKNKYTSPADSPITDRKDGLTLGNTPTEWRIKSWYAGGVYG